MTAFDTPPARRWDYVPADWHAEAVLQGTVPDVAGGALMQLLTADVMWRNLTRSQRELLLSMAAGFPIKARADVTARMFDRGLVTAYNTLTPAGRLLVQWRPTKGTR